MLFEVQNFFNIFLNFNFFNIFLQNDFIKDYSFLNTLPASLLDCITSRLANIMHLLSFGFKPTRLQALGRRSVDGLMIDRLDAWLNRLVSSVNTHIT